MTTSSADQISSGAVRSPYIGVPIVLPKPFPQSPHFHRRSPRPLPLLHTDVPPQCGHGSLCFVRLRAIAFSHAGKAPANPHENLLCNSSLAKRVTTYRSFGL